MPSTLYSRWPVVSGGSGGVTSLNALLGALNIVAGTGISVTPSGTDITIANTATAPTFSDSLVNTAGIVTLVNDSATPGNSKLYGTNSSGVLGFYNIPVPNAGTVTSVGLSLPGIITVTNSPVTGSGTLTGTLAAQNANKVWAGPASGSDAIPTFRALTSADLPAGTNYWTEASSTLYPTTSTDRVLIGGATDDTTSALQVLGSIGVQQSNGVNFTMGTNNTGDFIMAFAPSLTSIQIGYQPTPPTGTFGSVIIGQYTPVLDGTTFVTAIGNTDIGSSNTIGIGYSQIGTNSVNSIAIGYGSIVADDTSDAIAIGYLAQMQGMHAVALGSHAQIDVFNTGLYDYTVQLGYGVALSPGGLNFRYYSVMNSAGAFTPGLQGATIVGETDASISLNPSVSKEVEQFTFPAYSSATGGDYIAFYDESGTGWAAALNKSGSDPEPTGAVWLTIPSGNRVNVDISSVAGTAASYNGDIPLSGGTATLTVTCDTPGSAGNVTIYGDSSTDCATLIGAGYTITAGGSAVIRTGGSVNIYGGADAVAANFYGYVYNPNNGDFYSAVTCNTPGPAGNTTIYGDGISDCATLSGSGYTWVLGGSNILDSGNYINISGGADAIAASFNNLVPLVDAGTATLTVTCNSVGSAGDMVITGDATSDCATLIGAGYTITAGGTDVLPLGAQISITGGVDVNADNVANLVVPALNGLTGFTSVITLVAPNDGFGHVNATQIVSGIVTSPPSVHNASDTGAGSITASVTLPGAIGENRLNAQTRIGATSTTLQHELNTATGTPASGAGTLLNLPAGCSGDPSGWINIKINGSTAYVPYWLPSF